MTIVPRHISFEFYVISLVHYRSYTSIMGEKNDKLMFYIFIQVLD